MTFTGFDLYINSGQGTTHYDKDDNLSNIEVTNSDNEYYQNGMMSFYNVDILHNIGDTVQLYISDENQKSLQFDGYITRRQTSIAGKRIYTYQMVGKTYDLWRYVTGTEAKYIDCTTAAIAKDLVDYYCEGVVLSNDIDTAGGTSIIEELDLSNVTVGEALVTLIGMDGYKFYVDTDGELQYYKPTTDESTYNMIIEEDDIIEVTPIEQADEDLVNDVLVVGGSGYSAKTSITNKEPAPFSSQVFPSGILVAQSFTAEDDMLQALRMYLHYKNSSTTKVSDLDFEIWEGTQQILFDDPYDNYNYMSNYKGITVDGFSCNPQGTLKLKYKDAVSQDFWSLPEVFNEAATSVYHAQMFKCTDTFQPTRFTIYGRSYYTQNYIYEIRTIGADNISPTTTILCTGNKITTLGNYFQSDDGGPYLYPPTRLISGNLYAMVIRGQTPANKWVQANLKNSTKGSGMVSSDGTTWTRYTIQDSFYLGQYTDFESILYGIKFSTNGYVSSNNYICDCQYMKVTLTDTVSSQLPFIKISGTNRYPNHFVTLSDGMWYDFGAEKHSGAIKIKLSGNGGFTPKIGSCRIEVSDSTGAFSTLMYSDSFDNYNYLSGSQTTPYSYTPLNMIVNPNTLHLELSGSINGLVDKSFYHPDTVPYSQMNNGSVGDKTTYISLGGGYSEYDLIFKFNTKKFVDKVQIVYYTGGGGDLGKPSLQEIYVSGESVGDTWHAVNKTGEDATGWGYIHTWETYLSNTQHIYSGVRAVKLHMHGGYYQSLWYDVAFRCRERYSSSAGTIQSKNYQYSLTTEATYVRVNPIEGDDGASYITYSGSCDSGCHWTKLIKNNDTTVSEPGRYIKVMYNMQPYGSWPAGKISSAVLYPASPYIDSIDVYTGINQGGGIPKSGSNDKIIWSDDFNFTNSDISYPPSYSSWHTWSEPKLRLEEGKTYWMIFYHMSGGCKYWEYHYNPDTTLYDGSIKYSGIGPNFAGQKIRWSSNQMWPSKVPIGNMVFDLGWREGEVTYRDYDQDSINLYGRHFKKISDSNITTTEAAQLRAENELANALTIPHKGTITIQGTLDISTDYRFYSDLTNFGIEGTHNIVSYTQRINKESGFTTSIDFGAHPFDVMKELSNIEKKVT